MKTILPIFLLCLAVCTAANAQSPFRFGLAFEGHLSGLNAPDGPSTIFSTQVDHQLKTSFSLGGILEYGFNHHFYLQTGVKWLNRGSVHRLESDLSRFNSFNPFLVGSSSSSTPVVNVGTVGPSGFFSNSPNTIEYTREKVNYDFIGIPIELKYRFGHNAAAFYVLGGIHQSFLISRKIQRTHFWGEQQRADDAKYTSISKFRRFNTGFVFGLGYDMPLGTNCALSLEPRAEWLPLQYDLDSEEQTRLYSFGLNASLWFW